MTAKVLITIMAHPKRAGMVVTLGTELLNQGLPAARLVVAWDQANSCWDTARRAMRLGLAAEAEGFTHTIVLQDDTFPVPGFVDALPAIVAARPDHLVAFFCRERERGQKMIDKGYTWLRSKYTTGQATLFPNHLMRRWLEYQRDNEHLMPMINRGVSGGGCDGRLAWWMKTDVPERAIWYTVPDLFEHVGNDRSLMKHHAKAAGGFFAYHLAEKPATEYDWSLVPPYPPGKDL